MARPFRTGFPGALDHVMSHGSEQRRIVRDDADRQKWIEWLSETVKTCGWRERRIDNGPAELRRTVDCISEALP